MKRRTFVTGSLLAAGCVAGGAWWTRLAPWDARAREVERDALRLPDGRTLTRVAGLAFGTTVSIVVAHADAEQARAAGTAALAQARRVDALMTVYRPESEVSRLNATGALDDPDPHLVRVLERSQRLAELSDGTFDVTVQPLWQLYARCRRRGELPSHDALAAARSYVDWSAIEVSPRRIAFKRHGMSITLNGIAQGYATDLALAALGEHGIEDALVDAGEYAAEGTRQAGRPWTVGLRHPRDPEAVIAAIAMDGRCLATSGDYEATFSDDFLFHHIFDPRTGCSPRALSSVAVAAPSGADADALTKPMMVLDLARARALLAHFPDAGAVWIDKQSRIVATHHLQLMANT